MENDKRRGGTATSNACFPHRLYDCNFYVRNIHINRIYVDCKILSGIFRLRARCPVESRHNRFFPFVKNIAGILSFFTVFFFLKETNKNIGVSGNFIGNGIQVLKDGKFMAANAAGCVIYTALMVYISNSSLIFMEKFSVSGRLFSVIFFANSLSIMLGSAYISKKSGQNKSAYYLKLAFASMILCSAAFFASVHFLNSLILFALSLFATMFFLGMLFPLTTNLALKPFSESNKSGTASVIFGFSQLGTAFACTILLNNISNNPIVLLAATFCGCSILGILPFIEIRKKETAKA